MNEEFVIDEKMLVQSRKAIENRTLCLNCIGRLFGKLGHGLSNKTRGEKIYSRLGMRISEGKCWLCDDIIKEIPKFSDLVINELNKWDYSSFLIGTRLEKEILAREEEIWMQTGAQYPELLKSELNREIGKLVETKIGKYAKFDIPDITSIVDTRYDLITLQVNSLFIYGRYLKFQRGIPQTKWFCRICFGRGIDCKHCNGKGKMYETSVEELIAGQLMKAAGGIDHAFHGMGREDIDALMLGNGRPFIIEIKRPMIRGIPINNLEEQINKECSGKIKVMNMKFTTQQEVERLKSLQVPKTYHIKIRIPSWHEGKEKLKKGVSIFGGLQITQQTPTRVVHRRADLIRKKRILEVNLIDWIDEEKKATLSIKAESGTYIKELITGDEGRTKPNISESIGSKCEILELDVVKIHDEEVSEKN